MRPNTFVIGAHKAGTTRFCGLLAQHPDVFMSSPKEPGYFARIEPSDAARARYSRLFDGVESESIVVDGSTIYSQRETYPGTCERIAEAAPDASIIYLVRNPLDRVLSAWVQYRSEGRRDVQERFSDALRSCTQLLDASRYAAQLEEYETRFSRVHIVFFEEFAADEVAVMRDTFRFLGIDPEFRPDVLGAHRNASAGKRAPSPRMQRWMDRLGWSSLRPVKRFAKRNRESRVVRGVIRVGKRVMTREIARPGWDVASRAWFLEQVREDAVAFLTAQGKPVDYWDLE